MVISRNTIRAGRSTVAQAETEQLAKLLGHEKQRGFSTVAGWGLLAVAAFLAAFVSWQYSPSSSTLASARVTPDLPETTGSIAGSPSPTNATVPANRNVGGNRITTVLPVADVPLRSKDLDQIRMDLQEVKRTLGRLETGNDALERRVTGLEDQYAVVTAGIGRLASEPRLPALASKQEAAAPNSKPEARAPSNSQVAIANPAPSAGATIPLGNASAAVPASPAPQASVSTNGMASVAAVQGTPLQASSMSAQANPPIAGQASAMPNVPPISLSPPAALVLGPNAAPARAQFTPQAPNVAAQGPDIKSPTRRPTGADPIVTGSVTSPSAASTAIPVMTTQIKAAPQAASPLAPKADALSLASPASQEPPRIDASAEDPGSSKLGVDIGGQRSLAQLRKAWSDLQRRQPTATKGLVPLAQLKEVANGLDMRLVVGPFASQTEAIKFCSAARLSAANCGKTTYSGQAAVR